MGGGGGLRKKDFKRILCLNKKKCFCGLNILKECYLMVK